MAACSLSLGCVLVRDEQQDTRYQIDEDERAHAERNGVSARTLVDAPADDRHRDYGLRGASDVRVRNRGHRQQQSGNGVL